jgi:hypothetical protein
LAPARLEARQQDVDPVARLELDSSLDIRFSGGPDDNGARCAEQALQRRVQGGDAAGVRLPFELRCPLRDDGVTDRSQEGMILSRSKTIGLRTGRAGLVTIDVPLKQSKTGRD